LIVKKWYPTNDAIGTAYLAEDGTLTLKLHKNVETLFNFGAVLTITPDNPRYRKYLDHIGYLPRGERKSIPPWLFDGVEM
jgi:hypothetical protein